jgi:NTP pyrophosphatase (non-canonical NTP hydrolase)
LIGWRTILKLQDERFPSWKTKLPNTLYCCGLAGEAGEVCGVVTHLEGGGTNNRKYTKAMVLHQCADTYVQIVLLLAKYDFSEKDFEEELERTFKELADRNIAYKRGITE